MCVSRTQHSRMAIAVRRSRTTKVYLRLISLFLICVIPICIWNITQKNQMAGILIYCIYYQQYCLNCLIYFFALPNYQKACGQLLARIMCREIVPKMKPTGRKLDIVCDVFSIPIADQNNISVKYDPKDSTRSDTAKQPSRFSRNSVKYSKRFSNANSFTDIDKKFVLKRCVRITQDSVSSQWSFSQFSMSSELSLNGISQATAKRSHSLDENDKKNKKFKFRRQFSC